MAEKIGILNADKATYNIDMDGNMWIAFQVASDSKGAVRSICEEVRGDKPFTISVSWKRKSRSLDANAYLWVVCQKIAEVIRATKEEVYKKAIREVGQFEIVPIKEEAVDRWIENWGSRGLGWFAESMEKSKLDGYVRVITYFGSSTYDTKEMSVLIDYIVEEAKELGIILLSDSEIDLLKRGEVFK